MHGETVQRKASSEPQAGSEKMSARRQCNGVQRRSHELKQTDIETTSGQIKITVPKQDKRCSIYV
jgi:hypothetical protein